jgi:hypothetical protein
MFMERRHLAGICEPPLLVKCGVYAVITGFLFGIAVGFSRRIVALVSRPSPNDGLKPKIPQPAQPFAKANGNTAECIAKYRTESF